MSLERMGGSSRSEGQAGVSREVGETRTEGSYLTAFLRRCHNERAVPALMVRGPVALAHRERAGGRAARIDQLTRQPRSDKPVRSHVTESERRSEQPALRPSPGGRGRQVFGPSSGKRQREVGALD